MQSETVNVLTECKQFVDRMLLLLMPIKYQPDYIYLRHVQTSRVHYFTVVQITCSAVMWAVKSVKATSIAFPLMVCAYSQPSTYGRIAGNRWSYHLSIIVLLFLSFM